MSGILSKPKPDPTLLNPPTVTPQARMPSPNDQDVLEAERKAREKALSAGGRASTILTGKAGQGNNYDTFSSPAL